MVREIGDVLDCIVDRTKLLGVQLGQELALRAAQNVEGLVVEGIGSALIRFALNEVGELADARGVVIADSLNDRREGVAVGRVELCHFLRADATGTELLGRGLDAHVLVDVLRELGLGFGGRLSGCRSQFGGCRAKIGFLGHGKNLVEAGVEIGRDAFVPGLWVLSPGLDDKIHHLANVGRLKVLPCRFEQSGANVLADGLLGPLGIQHVRELLAHGLTVCLELLGLRGELLFGVQVGKPLLHL